MEAWGLIKEVVEAAARATVGRYVHDAEGHRGIVLALRWGNLTEAHVRWDGGGDDWVEWDRLTLEAN